MAAQRGHPFARPAVSPSGDQSAAGQSAGNHIIRADAHKHSDSVDNLLRRVSSAVAASSARNAQLRVDAALPVDDGNDLAGLSIYIHDYLFYQRSENPLLQASIGFRMPPHRFQVARQRLEL